jgi:hypothetical protein
MHDVVLFVAELLYFYAFVYAMKSLFAMLHPVCKMDWRIALIPLFILSTSLSLVRIVMDLDVVTAVDNF